MTEQVAGEEKREIRRKKSRGECPCCHRKVTFKCETESWVQTKRGDWKHHLYGPWEAVCEHCQIGMCDSALGFFSIDLREEAK